MKKKTSLVEFIKGPLSEQAGGNEVQRNNARLLDENPNSDDEESELKKRSSKIDFYLKKKALLFSYQNEIVLKLFQSNY